jgi:hypothetical protein
VFFQIIFAINDAFEDNLDFEKISFRNMKKGNNFLNSTHLRNVRSSISSVRPPLFRVSEAIYNHKSIDNIQSPPCSMNNEANSSFYEDFRYDNDFEQTNSKVLDGGALQFHTHKVQEFDTNDSGLIPTSAAEATDNNKIDDGRVGSDHAVSSPSFPYHAEAVFTHRTNVSRKTRDLFEISLPKDWRSGSQSESNQEQETGRIFNDCSLNLENLYKDQPNIKWMELPSNLRGELNFKHGAEHSAQSTVCGDENLKMQFSGGNSKIPQYTIKDFPAVKMIAYDADSKQVPLLRT